MHHRKGEEEVQHLKRVIFQTRQGGVMYGEYINNNSLGKSTRVLIGVRNREKIGIRSKQHGAIDFCFQLDVSYTNATYYMQHRIRGMQ